MAITYTHTHTHTHKHTQMHAHTHTHTHAHIHTPTHPYTCTGLVCSFCSGSDGSVLDYLSVSCTVLFLKSFTVQGVLCLKCSYSSTVLCLLQISDRLNFPGAPQTKLSPPPLCRALDAHLYFVPLTLQFWDFTASGMVPRPFHRSGKGVGWQVDHLY